jgi:hypothetical protein
VFLVVAEEGVEQRRRPFRPLEEPPGLQVLPALAVAHRRVGDAAEQVHAFDDRARDEVRASRQGGVVPHVADPQVERVDLLPHVGADLLAHLPRVLTRTDDAAGDRVGVRRLEQRVDQVGRLGGVGPLQAQARVEPFQGAGPGGRGPSQPEVRGDVDESGRVFGPLQVTADPIQRVGDTGQQHGLLEEDPGVLAAAAL